MLHCFFQLSLNWALRTLWYTGWLFWMHGKNFKHTLYLWALQASRNVFATSCKTSFTSVFCLIQNDLVCKWLHLNTIPSCSISLYLLNGLSVSCITSSTWKKWEHICLFNVLSKNHQNSSQNQCWRKYPVWITEKRVTLPSVLESPENNEVCPFSTMNLEGW